MDQNFYSPTKGKLSLAQTIQAVIEFLRDEPEAGYSLVIGTDSQERRINGHKEIDFVTAIVAHRRGYGGRYFWQKIKKDKVFSLRDKIYTETLLSLELAQQFVPQIKERLNGQVSKYDLEIHIDVGEKGETREMIREVVGMVVGNGFCAKTKPEAFGASTVADKHT